MEEQGKIFVNSPNAIPGNRVEKCDTSSAGFQSENTGLVDGVGTEEEILAEIRTLIGMLPCNNEEDVSYEECTDDLNRLCENMEGAAADGAVALSQISDGGVFFETKRAFARDMVTGFIRLNGMTVGAVANRWKVFDEEANVAEEFDGSLSANGAQKAADFVRFCDAFNIPVLTLTNVSGFKASDYDEKHLAAAAARLAGAFAEATVPKVNVITGKAFRQCLRGDEQQIHRGGYGLRLAVLPDRHDGARPGSEDHVRRWGRGDPEGEGGRVCGPSGQPPFCGGKRLCGYHYPAGGHQEICDRRI